MWEFVSSVWDSFGWIVTDIPAAIKNDLLFPHPPRSPEELIISKVRGQSSLINSQQDRLSYQTGVIRDQSRGIRELENLLVRKDTEIKNLKYTINSLEFQLQAEASRSKH